MEPNYEKKHAKNNYDVIVKKMIMIGMGNDYAERRIKELAGNVQSAGMVPEW